MTLGDRLLLAWIALAAVVFVALLFVPAPYGRYARRAWGPTIASRWAWLLMEAPAVLVMAGMFAFGRHRDSWTAVAFLVLWLLHYVPRAFVDPFLWREPTRRTPLAIVAMAIVFNVVNGLANGATLFDRPPGYRDAWLADPRFLLGTAIFALGYAINRDADRRLRHLRGPGESGYRIPRGGLFRWVSCPNYLGEIVIWCGWAIATWSLAGLAFALWTVANLAPRARDHQRFYRERFPEYPPERRALVPGVW